MIDGDRDLRDAFARLREAERKQVPRFRLEPARPAARPRLAIAMLMMIIVVASVVVTQMRHHKAAPPPVPLSTWRAPTDFLLQTPGRELVHSTPALRFNGGRS